MSVIDLPRPAAARPSARLASVPLRRLAFVGRFIGVALATSVPLLIVWFVSFGLVLFVSFGALANTGAYVALSVPVVGAAALAVAFLLTPRPGSDFPATSRFAPVP